MNGPRTGGGYGMDERRMDTMEPIDVTESELKRLIEDAGNGDRHAQGKLALMYAAGESVGNGVEIREL